MPPTLSPQVTPYYGGAQSVNPATVLQVAGVPSTAAYQNNLGTIAVNTLASTAYILVSKASNVANWQLIASGSSTGTVASITGTSGGAVGPDGAGNINLVGASGSSYISFAGTPGTNTLTATVTSLPVAQGGTGAVSFSNLNSLLLTGTTSTSAQTSIASGTSGFVLTSNGPGVPPTFQATATTLIGVTETAFPFTTALGQTGAITATGMDNTAVGFHALNVVGAGSSNTAMGVNAGVSVTGSQNTLLGQGVFISATTGSNNVAVGYNLAPSLTTGSNNTILGTSSASAYNGAESGNILIGNAVSGINGESHALHIGDGGSGITSAYIAGIAGTTVANTQTVTINSVTGQLGSSSSTPLIGITDTLTPFTTALGDLAGAAITTGANNVAVGYNALGSATTVTNNLAIGVSAMSSLTTTSGGPNSNQNIAIGNSALAGLLSGISHDNTAIGFESLQALTGGIYNLGIGTLSLSSLTGTSSYNTAIGTLALTSLLTGTGNTVVGQNSGTAYTGAESNNIIIGQNLPGTVGESNVIRLGSSQTSAFISGIAGVTVSNKNFVTINTSTGQLGSQAASGLSWSAITASQTLAVSNGYIVTSGALSLLLPATSVVGDIVSISLAGGTSWTITQAAGQSVIAGSSTSTVGTGGSVASAANGDSIQLVCSVANSQWVAYGFVGNLLLT